MPPPPEEIPAPENIVTEKTVVIPFVPRNEETNADDRDEDYRRGQEVETEGATEGVIEEVQWQFSDKAACDRPGYEYAGLIEWDTGGNNVIIGEPKEVKEDPKGRIAFRFEVQHINFRGNDSVTVVAKIHWRPQRETIDEVTERNKEAIKTFNEQTRYAFRKAFVDAARERIKLASKIEPRKFEELREEERIVVYRALIQDMLTRNISMPDDRTRHVVAELLNTIFDVEKMLYFVCAEWWRPRLHASYQGLGVPEKAPQLPEGGSGASVTQNWDLERFPAELNRGFPIVRE
jgi:hypothetical protein